MKEICGDVEPRRQLCGNVEPRGELCGDVRTESVARQGKCGKVSVAR